MQYHASEVALHNNQENGHWIIVENSIYDISQFIESHPGGSVVLINNTGRDATEDFKRIQHHDNPRITASLKKFLIGDLINIKLKDCSLGRLYKQWLDIHYLIIEMQNTLLSDYSFLSKPCTVDDLPLDLTPYKIELFLETHSRFVNGYLNLTLKKLDALKTLLTDNMPLKRSTTDTLNILSCQNFIKNSASLMRKKNSTIHTAKISVNKSWHKTMNAYRSLIEDNDKELLSEIKFQFTSGLKLFEIKNDEIEKHQLLTIIQSINLCITNYCELVELETLEILLDNHESISDTHISKQKILENEH